MAKCSGDWTHEALKGILVLVGAQLIFSNEPKWHVSFTGGGQLLGCLGLARQRRDSGWSWGNRWQLPASERRLPVEMRRHCWTVVPPSCLVSVTHDTAWSAVEWVVACPFLSRHQLDVVQHSGSLSHPGFEVLVLSCSKASSILLATKRVVSHQHHWRHRVLHSFLLLVKTGWISCWWWWPCRLSWATDR